MKNKAFGILAVFILIAGLNSGCAPTTVGHTVGGTLVGGAIGAGLGAAIGALVGAPGSGAAIGAIAGGVLGSTSGAITGEDLKRRRAAGMVVPPAPYATAYYQPWYDGQFWRHHGIGNQTLWWNENLERWE